MATSAEFICQLQEEEKRRRREERKKMCKTAVDKYIDGGKLVDRVHSNAQKYIHLNKYWFTVHGDDGGFIDDIVAEVSKLFIDCYVGHSYSGGKYSIIIQWRYDNNNKRKRSGDDDDNDSVDEIEDSEIESDIEEPMNKRFRTYK